MSSKEEPFNWSFFQILYLTFPIIILAISSLILGLGLDDLKTKPDWSFISILFFTESLRDSLEIGKLENFGETVIDVKIIFSILFIAISSIILFAMLAMDLGRIRVDKDVLTYFSLTVFFCGGFVCGVRKYQLKKTQLRLASVRVAAV